MSKSINIVNIVASATLAESFDLDHIHTGLDNTEYDKKKFPGLVYRIKDPKAAFLLFRSGKVNCTGTKNITDLDNAMGMLSAKLRGLKYNIGEHPEYTIQNMVASSDVGVELNLNALAIGLGLENVEYEPEVFPGMVYRISEPKLAVLLFRSGKIVIAGARSQSDCDQAREQVCQELDNLGML